MGLWYNSFHPWCPTANTKFTCGSIICNLGTVEQPQRACRCLPKQASLPWCKSQLECSSSSKHPCNGGDKLSQPFQKGNEMAFWTTVHTCPTLPTDWPRTITGTCANIPKSELLLPHTNTQFCHSSSPSSTLHAQQESSNHNRNHHHDSCGSAMVQIISSYACALCCE